MVDTTALANIPLCGTSGSILGKLVESIDADADVKVDIGGSRVDGGLCEEGAGNKHRGISGVDSRSNGY